MIEDVKGTHYTKLFLNPRESYLLKIPLGASGTKTLDRNPANHFELAPFTEAQYNHFKLIQQVKHVHWWVDAG